MWMSEYLSESVLLVLLAVYFGVELMVHMVILCLAFEEPSNCFPQQLHSFPTGSEWGFQFFHIFVNTCCFLFNASHPNVCKISRYTSFTGYFYDYKFLLYFCFAFYLIFCGFSRKEVKNLKKKIVPKHFFSVCNFKFCFHSEKIVSCL